MKLLRKALKIVLCLILIGAGGVAGFWFYETNNYKKNIQPAGEYLGEAYNQDQTFVIENGWSVTRISQELEDAGLINSAKSFKHLAKISGKSTSLMAGTYILSPVMSSQEILDELVHGQVQTSSFTIPEGYNLKQICQVFVEKGICTENEFYNEVENGDFSIYPFLESAPSDNTRLEGYLFPDTYTIMVGESVHSVFKRMLDRFYEITNEIGDVHSGLSLRDTVILASIVQNEIKVDEERPLAASVFINRLDKGMKLQSCATIQYILGEPKENLLYEDLEIESPYNTYLHEGLPIGPISCPGKASLEAAFNPADTDYLYFVVNPDTDGGHNFSSNSKDFQNDKNYYKKNK